MTEEHPQTSAADIARVEDTPPVWSIPAETRELLGPAPTAHFEDGMLYEDILTQMAQAVEPRDFVEWIWVKDLVDLTWDANRARRAKTTRLALARKEGIRAIITANRKGDPADIIFDSSIHHETDDIAVGKRGAMKEFAQTLDQVGLDQDSVVDAAYFAAIVDMERLQRLIDSANARRDAVLREIDRRREAFGRRVRPAVQALENIVDLEFE